MSYDDEGYDNELELLPDPPADRRGRVSPTEALEEDLEVAARRDPRQPAEVEVLLQRVHDLVATARSMPMSSSVMINRDEVLDLVEDVMDRLPDELRARPGGCSRSARSSSPGPAARPTRSSTPPGPRPSAWCSAPRS